MISSLEQYFAFVKKYPEMFTNPPGSEITILLDPQEIEQVEIKLRKTYEEKGWPIEWANIGLIHQDQYIFLLRDAVRFQDGTLGTYFRLVNTDQAKGVIILPLFNHHILLLRHFRHATRKWHLEVPRGFGISGSTDEENARRELEEETKATIIRMIPLGTSYVNTGTTSECNAFFLAEISSYELPKSYEGISDLLLVTIPEFERLMRENVVDENFTTVVYARAKLHNLL